MPYLIIHHLGEYKLCPRKELCVVIRDYNTFLRPCATEQPVTPIDICQHGTWVEAVKLVAPTGSNDQYTQAAAIVCR